MNPSQALSVVRQMGLPWVASRVGYAIKRRAGWLERRMPLRAWDDYRLSELAPGTTPDSLVAHVARAPFLASAHRGQGARDRYVELFADTARGAVREMEAARAGRFRYFHAAEVDAGWPPRWHRHPETGDEWPRCHWSRLPDMGGSDVKWLWEIGRFGAAYAAVRAWRATGEAAHAEAFWALAESWREANPPNRGAHWMCGQECSLRVLAWCFALFGLADAPATTPARVASLVEMLAAHGDRIEANVGYAVSQKNNHAVNEALALWTLGTIFPVLPAAARWEARGRELLEREARRQIYGDGAYVQHSFNYHRMIVQSYAWALRLGELAGRPFSEDLRERYGRAVRFLYQVSDAGGRAPNYGSNDGALLLPLDGCEFEDYRPALALGFWAAERRRVFEPGPWDEPLFWLYGDEPLAAETDPPPREDLAAREGGYYTLRGRETWALVRCCAYENRPAQADMLHVDVWWRGVNVVADPGTYSYNSPAPWSNGLSGTGAHNAVSVDGLDQMERGARFTWFEWARGRAVRGPETLGGVKLFEGEHDGFARRAGVTHRRALLLAGDALWIVVDDLVGKGEHDLSSSWLFPGAEFGKGDGEGEALLRGPAGELAVTFLSFSGAGGHAAPALERVVGDRSSTRGWVSSKYSSRVPALTVVARERVALPARRVTMISLGARPEIEAADAVRLAVRIGAARIVAEWEPLSSAVAGTLVVSAAVELTDGGSG